MYLFSLYPVIAEAEPTSVVAPIESILESNILNFIIVVIFLIWIIRKTQVFSVIGKKIESIKQSIKNSEEEKIRAELELDSVKKRLRRSDEEISKILDESKEIADSLSSRIIKEADIEATELEKRAGRNIEAEKQMISGEITKEISKASFVLAEEHIKQSIDDRLHRKFIDNFLEELAKMKV